MMGRFLRPEQLSVDEDAELKAGKGAWQMTCLGPIQFLKELASWTQQNYYFTFPYHAAYPEYPLLRLSYASALVSIPSVILQEPECSKKIDRGRRRSVKLSHHGLHSAAQSA